MRGRVPRFALMAAANDGGLDRPPLQYALSDADRFARVIVTLGGVAADDAIVLKQPKLKQLEEALDLIKSRVSGARGAGDGGRVELVFDYSGHADDKGLLPGEDRYSSAACGTGSTRCRPTCASPSSTPAPRGPPEHRRDEGRRAPGAERCRQA